MATLRKEKREKGLTVLTKSFSAARRSWHLKLDIDTDEMMSAFIVERGMPIDLAPKGENYLYPNFSSCNIEFEFVYSNYTRKHPMFFSFAHNTNQIVGLKKILSLKNLENSTNLTVRIRIKELFVHSALMNNISSSFCKLYQNHSKNNLMRLSFPLVYQILKSHTLRVPDENMVLSFLYHYQSDALDLLQ